MKGHTLEFEKPVQDLEDQIRDLKETSKGLDISHEIKALERKVDRLIKDIYGNLTPWQRVLLSRHADRPHSVDYINAICKDFHEIHGDRRFSDDLAMITGFGTISGQKVAIIGIEKGRKTNEKIKRNFGMPMPEGYRKALRLMKLAGQFNIPIVTFIDTPGAYPGIDAEERGQSQAIAQNLEEVFSIEVPIVSVIIGEGGSGGALGIGVADRVFMMEYSTYSVISPEACASILWSDPKMAEDAANSLQMGPRKALELGIIDDTIPEPPGGAHRDPQRSFDNVKKTILDELKKLSKLDTEKLIQTRFQKFRGMGNATVQGSESDLTKLRQN